MTTVDEGTVVARGGGATVARDLDEVAGWEVRSEALFVCRAHTTRAELEAEFGPGEVEQVTWARVELTTFYCAIGDHWLEPEPPSDGVADADV